MMVREIVNRSGFIRAVIKESQVLGGARIMSLKINLGLGPNTSRIGLGEFLKFRSLQVNSAK
jgi:hypothetical protein